MYVSRNKEGQVEFVYEVGILGIVIRFLVFHQEQWKSVGIYVSRRMIRFLVFQQEQRRPG